MKYLLTLTTLFLSFSSYSGEPPQLEELESELFSISSFLSRGSSQAMGINGAGNGGDSCENKINSIRDDISEWIKKGGSQYLNLPSNIGTADYNSAMSSAIQKAQINCTGKTLRIGKSEKTCINFSDQSDTPWIICQFSRFSSLSAEDKYQIIHHEYAGISGYEVNEDEASDYIISNQISGFLKNHIVKKLAVIKPSDIDAIKSTNGSVSLVNFYNTAKEVFKDLNSREFSKSHQDLDKDFLIDFLNSQRISSLKYIVDLLPTGDAWEAQGDQWQEGLLFTYADKDRISSQRDELRARYSTPTYREISSGWSKNDYRYGRVKPLSCVFDKEKQVLVLEEYFWRGPNSKEEMKHKFLSCLLLPLRAKYPQQDFFHYTSRYRNNISGIKEKLMQRIEAISLLITLGHNYDDFQDLNPKKIKALILDENFIFTNEELLDQNGFPVTAKLVNGMILFSEADLDWDNRQLLFHELLRLAYYTYNDSRYLDDDYSISLRINAANTSILDLAQHGTVFMYDTLKQVFTEFVGHVKRNRKKKYKRCSARKENAWAREKRLPIEDIKVKFDDSKSKITLSFNSVDYTLIDGIYLRGGSTLKLEAQTHGLEVENFVLKEDTNIDGKRFKRISHQYDEDKLKATCLR